MDFPTLKEDSDQLRARQLRDNDLDAAIKRTVGKLMINPHLNMGRLATLNFDVLLTPTPTGITSTLRVHETTRSMQDDKPIAVGNTIDVIAGEFMDVIGEHQLLSVALHFEWSGPKETQLVCQRMPF